MRDRLIELILESEILCHTCGENTDSYCAEALADHLLASGVIVPPCKVGDTVHYFYEGSEKVYEGVVTSFVYVSGTQSFSIHCDGVYGRYGRYFFLGEGRVDAIATAERCIEAFKKDHNTEHLVDAANYLMFRFMYPMPGEFFRPTDSSGSVGTVGTPINMERECD